MEVYKLGAIYLFANWVLFYSFYKLLINGLTKNKIKPNAASLTFWLFIVLMPNLLFYAFLNLGNYIYTNYAALRVPSWDVALTFVLPFFMFLTYLIGLAFAVFSAKKFLEFME